MNKDIIIFNIVHYSTSIVMLIITFPMMLASYFFSSYYTVDRVSNYLLRRRYEIFKYYYDKHALFEVLKRDFDDA